MNNDRRIALGKIHAAIEQIADDLSEILEQEQETYNNMPESLQSSDRGLKSDNAIGLIETAASALSEACDNISLAWV